MGDIKCHRPLSIESVLLPAEGKRPQRSFIFGSYAFQMPNWNEPSEVDDECRQLNEYPPDGKRPSSLKPHLSYCYSKRRDTHHDNRTRTDSSKSSEKANPAVHIVGPSPDAGKGRANLNQIAHQSAAGVD